MKKDKKPIIAITMGDPAGVGPEIVLKALQNRKIISACYPLVVGDSSVINRAAKLLGIQAIIRNVKSVKEAKWNSGIVNVFSIDQECRNIRYGQISAVAGEAGYQAIKGAINLALSREVAGTVTAPIHKEALNLAGHKYPGQTEIYAGSTATSDYTMLLIAGNLRVVHVSTHVSLLEACKIVTQSRVESVIKLAHRAGEMIGIRSPKIGVAGLNPHASDGGLFGTEDLNEITPAIKAMRFSGIDVEGPFPADTLFPKANGGYFDFVVVMYHDQGHIPLKLLGFNWNSSANSWDSVEGVNITLGIPIIRVSVDHGTAFDIAGTGKASDSSMVQAILYATKMANV